MHLMKYNLWQFIGMLSYRSFDLKDSLRMEPRAETCRLIQVKNGILLGELVGWCFNCKNIHAMNNTKLWAVCGDTQYITNSMCNNVLKLATP